MAIQIVLALAILFPLCGAVYSIVRRTEDPWTVRINLLTAGLVALAWVMGSQREATKTAELAAVQAELTVAQEVPEHRGFTPEERRLMLDRLKSIAGPSVFVLANAKDAETSQYARQIGAVFKDAGWEVPPSLGMILFTPVLLPGQEDIPPGVLLGVSAEVPEHIETGVFEALKDAGIDVNKGPHWPGTEHPISVLVGPNRRP